MNRQRELHALRIAVLLGGRSGEREVSLQSGAAVLQTLRDGGYEPALIDTGDANWWTTLQGVDLAFNIQHGRGGEDGVTQGLLDAMGVVGTGSGILGCALAMDKLRSKRLWQSEGLPTAEFVAVDEHTDPEVLLNRWGSAFIKPAREGSSLGMSRVDDVDEFRDAVVQARRFDDRVLAEAFIDGPEYTVAILGDRALPSIRIESAAEFYDYDAKYLSDATRYHVPSGLDEATEQLLQNLALRAFASLDCRVWGRVDVMKDPRGGFQLLEANTVPGMTSHSLVPMAAHAAGLSPLELLEEIMWLSWQQRQDAKGGSN